MSKIVSFAWHGMTVAATHDGERWTFPPFPPLGESLDARYGPDAEAVAERLGGIASDVATTSDPTPTDPDPVPASDDAESEVSDGRA